MNYLRQAGYMNYEISNWSLPGHPSRHNLTYWQNLPTSVWVLARILASADRFSDERDPLPSIKRLQKADPHR